MIIAGAGGHGLEVSFALHELGFITSEIYFFDEDKSKSHHNSFKDSLILELEELRRALKKDQRFMLGVGNPIHREKLFQTLSRLGGSLYGIRGLHSLRPKKSPETFDAMPYSYIGPETTIGLGVLVNAYAHVHHECEVGDFSEIGPGAMLLGGAKIGAKCRIGAGAVLLPGVELGDGIIVGAGAVVTKSVFEKSTLVGVPARKITL